MSNDSGNFGDNALASVTRGAGTADPIGMEGRYDVTCYDKDGNIKWLDYIENQVVAEGKIFMLSQLLTTSVALVGPFMGLINSNGTTVASNSLVAGTTYIITSVGGATFPGASSATVGVVFTATGPGTAGGTTTQIGTFSARDTQASHTGWTEHTASITTRATVTFGTPTETLTGTTPGTNEVTAATSPTTVSFSIGAAGGTIGGCFIITGTGAVNTLSNTSGKLYSAGAFSAGPKVVTNGDSLSVTYKTTATS